MDRARVDGGGSLRHGHYATYKRGACRCEECRGANRAYERALRRRKAYGGGYFPWVDASAARAHVRSLMAPGVGSTSGMGWKRIARAAGVSENTVSKLLYSEWRGGRRTPPTRRLHRRTEQKLLAVRCELPDGATVDAAPTWELIECLKGFGVPYGRINRALGNASGGLQLSRRKVTVRNAKKIERLHWALWHRTGQMRLHCCCKTPEYIEKFLEDA